MQFKAKCSKKQARNADSGDGRNLTLLRGAIRSFLLNHTRSNDPQLGSRVKVPHENEHSALKPFGPVLSFQAQLDGQAKSYK